VSLISVSNAVCVANAGEGETVCCSVLQCVAVCCSVLQCVAVSLLQCAWQMMTRVRQSVAECCRVLQSVAVCCSALQCDAV